MTTTSGSTLECAALMDRNMMLLPVPIEVIKNFSEPGGERNLFNINDPTFSEAIFCLPLEKNEKQDYISIRADYKVRMVRSAEIIYVESVGEYLRLHLTDGSKVVTLFRLKNMESALPSDSFMRVHRSYIVNLDRVSSYSRGKIYMDNGDDVPLSVNYRELFRKYLEKTRPTSGNLSQ